MRPSFIQLCAAILSFTGSLFFPAFCLVFLSGCAAPGPKYLNLSYPAAHAVKDKHQSVGLSRFNDKRPDSAKGRVGYRQLWGDKQEIFAVTGQDLSAVMTRVFRTFLEQSGFSVVLLPPWPATAEGVSRMPQEFTHVFAADINRFACRAVKTGVTTEMTLIIDVTFHQGTPDKGRLSIIPVVLTLERTELVFSRKKLETFINDAIEEIFVKAFPSL